MTDHDLVGALRVAITRADPSWVNQTSHLRRRLEEELGTDARRHRTQIHQLIVAAEERVPLRLKRNGWSPIERDELVQLLVTTRGWTADASTWAVTMWAVALGLTNEPPVTPAVATPAPSVPGKVTKPRTIEPNSDRPDPTELPFDLVPSATAIPTDMPDSTSIPSELVPAATDARAAPQPSQPDRAVAPRAHVAAGPPLVAPVIPLVTPATTSVTPLTPPPVQPPVAWQVVPLVPPTVPAVHAAPPSSPRSRRASAEPLPTKGTKKCTARAAAFLGRELDVAYEAKAGASPAWLLCLLPLLLAALIRPPTVLSVVVVMAFFPLMLIGNLLWPSRFVAIAGDDVWLLSKKRGRSLKVTGMIGHTTRDRIKYRGGGPFPSVWVADIPLWFVSPFRGAARRLPVPTEEAAR